MIGVLIMHDVLQNYVTMKVIVITNISRGKKRNSLLNRERNRIRVKSECKFLHKRDIQMLSTYGKIFMK